MHIKTRKHSALLLLMAPIIAIGSSALVAGTAASAGGDGKESHQPNSQDLRGCPRGIPLRSERKRGVLQGLVRSFHGQDRGQPRI